MHNSVFRWFRWRDPAVCLFALLVIMSSPSSDGNQNDNQQSSSCHAFPIHPWNSRLWNSQRSATRRTPSSTLASTTEDATTAAVNGGSSSHAAAVAATSHNNLKTSEVLSLDSIRASLIRQEETIIFALIERAQFRHNPIVYAPGGLGDLGVPPGSSSKENEELSFLEYMLLGTEALHFAVRRYTSPEEHGKFLKV